MNRCIEINFDSYKKSIKKLSFDEDNSISLCNFRNKFLDYEKIVKLKRAERLPKAVDMLFIDENKKEVWFVEFKNTSKKNVESYYKNERKCVKRKIFDSLISFYELFDKKYCCYFSKNYYVVYKCEKDDVHLELFNEFEDREIYFGLKEMKNKFLEDIRTDCCEVFLDFFSKNYDINWN